MTSLTRCRRSDDMPTSSGLPLGTVAAVSDKARSTIAVRRLDRMFFMATSYSRNGFPGLGRTDGGDAHPGAVRGARVGLRAQARWHPPARVQARDRRPPAVAQPAVAESAGGCRGDRGAAA